jgi:hypothetical protein
MNDESIFREEGNSSVAGGIVNHGRSAMDGQSQGHIVHMPNSGIMSGELRRLLDKGANGGLQPSSTLQANTASPRKYGYTLDELVSLLTQSPPRYVVEGLLPADDVHVAVGDSGLGKTPWAYQLGLCVAAGVPFLGHYVTQSRVLYFDLENGYQEIVDVSRGLCGYLGVTPFPNNFIVIPNDGNPPNLEEAVAERKPGLVIIDTLRAFEPLAEGDNPRMGQTLGTFRAIAREQNCAILLLHHTRKPGEMGAAALEDTAIIEWLNEASGARALINQTNARIALEKPRSALKDDVALLMKAHIKLKGESGLYQLERICDNAGEPIGYSPLAGVDLLRNADQETAFRNLPPKFSFAEAKRIYRKSDNPTKQWLNKCEAVGLIVQTGRGRYETAVRPGGAQKDEEGDGRG